MSKITFDGKIYDYDATTTYSSYEAPFIELPANVGIKMTRKGWADGIPGSCTNCALAISGRDPKNPLVGNYFSDKVRLRGIWVARTVADLFLSDGKTEVGFKSTVPTRTRKITAVNDTTEWENRGKCPEEVFWFLKMTQGKIARKRLKDVEYNNESRPRIDFCREDKAHKSDAWFTKKEELAYKKLLRAEQKPQGDTVVVNSPKKVDNPLRDGRGKVIHHKKV